MWNFLSKILKFFFAGGLTSKQNDDGSWSDWEASDSVAGQQIDNLGNSLIAKYAGTELTNAEREANAFSASEAEKARQFEQQSSDVAWQREMEASNTAYQRKVADLKAAGINPLMAVSGGVSLPSASLASSSSPSSVSPVSESLGSLLNAIASFSMVKAQRKNVEADTHLKNAQASNVSESERGSRLQNDYFELVSALRAEGEALANTLNRSKVAQIDKTLDEIDAHIYQLKESAATEISKRDLNLASSVLARANARQVVELLPYEKAYKSAQTEEAKAAALLASANAAYQNGLIDAGYIDFVVSNAAAGAQSAEAKAELDNIKAAIRTGDYSKVHHRYGLVSDVLSSFAILLDNFNPLGGLFK